MRLDYVVALLPGAWAEIKRRRIWLRMASVRVSLLEYVSAAYARQDSVAFRQACDALVAYSPAGSAVMNPVAAKVLSGPASGDAGPAGASCALVLAALTDLDYGRAEGAANELARRCRAKEFRRLESAVLEPWAEAAAALVRRESTAPAPHFRAIATAPRSYMDRELERWDKGQPTELSSVDFWDWATTALSGIARSFGYGSLEDEDTSWVAFADEPWTHRQG